MLIIMVIIPESILAPFHLIKQGASKEPEMSGRVIRRFIYFDCEDNHYKAEHNPPILRVRFFKALFVRIGDAQCQSKA